MDEKQPKAGGSGVSIPGDKQKLKLIWRLTTIIAIVTFLILIAVYLLIGAETIAAIILAAVSAVVFWYAMILIAVRLLVPGLSDYLHDAIVKRVQDEIEVESPTNKTGDLELDEYVDSYAKARDFWGKTGMMLLVGIFLALLYFIFGAP